MPMNENEKRCLSLAVEFIAEARKQVHYDDRRILTPSTIEVGGTLIGQIASDKYNQCMQAAKKEKVAAR